MSRKRGYLDDEAAQNKLRQTEAAEKRILDSDLRGVLASPGGRRVVWWLLDEVAGIHNGSFTGNNSTFYNEGRRAVGLDLMLKIQSLDPAAYATMIDERMRYVKEQNISQKVAKKVADEE